MNILFQAVVEAVSTRKDKTVKVVLGTNEMTPADGAKLLSLSSSHCFVYIKDNPVVDAEISEIDSAEIAESTGKTQSQRLRGVLYRNWEKNNEGFAKFDSYYIHKTEQIINHLKSKL